MMRTRERNVKVLITVGWMTSLLLLPNCRKTAALQSLRDAQNALNRAKEAQAERYAPEQFSLAQNHLQTAQDRADRHKWRQSHGESKVAKEQADAAYETALRLSARPVPVKEMRWKFPRERIEPYLKYFQMDDIVGLSSEGPGVEVRYLQRVYFHYERAIIPKDMFPVLEANVEWLKGNPNFPVVIEGHTDERGTRKYNWDLGLRRAKSVKQYLVRSGISKKRIRIVSYGEKYPDELGHNRQAWKMNRRDVFILLLPPGS